MRKAVVAVMRHLCVGFGALILLIAVSPPYPRVMAAEGGSSLYLPGASGNFGVAATPAPGFYVQNDFYYFSGDVGATVLSGRANIAIDTEVFLDMITATWVPEVKVLGGQYAAAVFVPFGYAELNVSATAGPFAVARNFDRFDLADIGIAPLVLLWNFGTLNVGLTESIIFPTGGYSTNRVLNLGRNYFAFDTTVSLGLTIPELSTELAIQPGIMVNTENPKTNYRTGTEFHMDWMANYYVKPTLALGIQGYVYQQIEGDSGSGAVLGDFKGEAAAVGPALMWVPIIDGKPVKVMAKWMHEFHARRRLKGDWVQIQGSVQF